MEGKLGTSEGEGLIGFLLCHSLSADCVKYLMLGNESHTDRNDHLFSRHFEL